MNCRGRERNGEAASVFRDGAGAASLNTCVLIVFLSAVLAVVLFYAEAFVIAGNMKREVELMLDGLVMTEALREYLPISDGTDDCRKIDTKRFAASLKERFPDAYRAKGKDLVFKDGKKKMYTVSFPSVGISDSPRLHLYADFTLKIPVTLGESQLGTLEIPVRVVSKYYPKYS